MYPFILELEYWDDIEPEWKKMQTRVLIYASSMSAAVALLEESNFVPNLENIKVISAGEDGMFFEVPEHIAKIFADGGGNYCDGLVETKSAAIRDQLHNDAKIINALL